MNTLPPRYASPTPPPSSTAPTAPSPNNQTGSRQGTAAATAKAERAARAAVETGAAVETAWATIVDALQLFPPTGALNTRARAEAIIATALPLLDEPVWAMTRQAPTRPQLLTFLDCTQERLATLPVAAEVREAAVQAEGLRQRAAALRMQQSRHRRMPPGLLALKRLYWNCRRFGTGHRRRQTPYGLLGVPLPTMDWWELLRMPPEQLRQQLSAPRVAA